MSLLEGVPVIFTRRSPVYKRYVVLGLVLVMLGFTIWQVLLYAESTQEYASQHRQSSSVITPSLEHQDGTVTLWSALPVAHYHRPNFEAGIVFPQWSANAYGADWQAQLTTIRAQTGAKWMEMTVFFSQATPGSTRVATSQSTPTVQSFAAGVSAARAHGYHVFVVPLMGVNSPAGQWAGTIQFSNIQDETSWFDSYWQALQPYALAAARAGAEQLAIGTELVHLQQAVPSALWNTLIARLHSVFPGMLTYDMNWTSLNQPLPGWMRNPQLALIGVSEYFPLVKVPVRVEPKDIFGLWKTIVRQALDAISTQLGKPIFISEIGYRNSVDALYDSWLPNSTTSPPDPVEQAAACEAALANVIPDAHIVGIFFWGWDNVEGFRLSGQPATAVLNHWYTSLRSDDHAAERSGSYGSSVSEREYVDTSGGFQ